MSSNTTILLVPGSFSKSVFFDKMVPLIEAQGYKAEKTELPSCGERPESEGGPADMFDDAKHLASVITRLADRGEDVVMAMSSYGGFPGNESAKGLSKKEREAEGKKGGLTGLVFIASFLPPVGVSSNDIQAAEAVDSIKIDPTSTDPYMHLNYETDWAGIFNDLPEAEARRWMNTMPNHSKASFTSKLTYPAYLYIPSIYYHTKNDMIVRPEKQLQMIKDANEKIEKEGGKKVRVWESDAGHLPMLSQPQDVVDACVAAVKGW